MSEANASTRRLFASRAAVLVLAIVSSYFVLVTLSIAWAPNGGFGVYVDQQTGVVSYSEPRNVAKGIHVGDRVDLAAMSFYDRAHFYEIICWPPGTRMTVKTVHAGRPHTATVEAVATDYPNDQTSNFFASKIVAMVCILVAVILVWSRPNPMLWGLAAFLIGTHEYFCGDMLSPPIAALMIFSLAFVCALGPAGLIVFAARFPDNRRSRTTIALDAIAAAVFLFEMFVGIYGFMPLFTTVPIADLPGWTQYGASVTEVAVFFVLCWKLLRAKSRSPWRSFRWVVVGYGVGIVLGWVGLGDVLNAFTSADQVTWWPTVAQKVLVLALPASIAYAMIRHRAFGLGYLANRTLVCGAFAIAAVSTIVFSLWFASWLNSSVAIALAMFVALLAGMTVRSSRALIVRFVDRIFLRRRYEAAVSLDALRDTLRGSNDPKHLTDEVATTLGLASLAVFSRVADGGFVRNAAFGWPPGSAWHLLPEEALTRTLDDDGSAIVRVPDDEDDLALPLADARPQFALAVRRGDRVERAIFIGPQRNGASLDRDAMRSLHGMFDEAIFA